MMSSNLRKKSPLFGDLIKIVADMKPHKFFSTSMYVAEQSKKFKVWEEMVTRPPK